MENREEAAAAEVDDGAFLAIAIVLRGAVVDAAALDRARAWSKLLEDISRWRSSEREAEGVAILEMSKKKKRK